MIDILDEYDDVYIKLNSEVDVEKNQIIKFILVSKNKTEYSVSYAVLFNNPVYNIFIYLKALIFKGKPK